MAIGTNTYRLNIGSKIYDIDTQRLEVVEYEVTDMYAIMESFGRSTAYAKLLKTPRNEEAQDEVYERKLSDISKMYSTRTEAEEALAKYSRH